MSSIYRFLSKETLDETSQIQYQYITQMRNITTLHDHDFCEVFLVAYGEVDHLCNQTLSRLTPGDMILIRPDDQHCYHPIQGTECGLFNLAFPTAILIQAVEYLTGQQDVPFLSARVPPTVHLPSSQLRDWSQQFQDINVYPQSQGQAQGIYVRRLLIQLLGQFFLAPQALHASGKKKAPAWLIQLRQDMLHPDNFTGGIETMLSLCPCTKEHLYRQFQKYYKETPSAFLHQLRLSYAGNLLAHTDTSISQIALEAGYDNLGYFYQCFKEQFAMTPKAYRHLTRKNAVE